MPWLHILCQWRLPTPTIRAPVPWTLACIHSYYTINTIAHAWCRTKTSNPNTWCPWRRTAPKCMALLRRINTKWIRKARLSTTADMSPGLRSYRQLSVFPSIPCQGSTLVLWRRLSYSLVTRTHIPVRQAQTPAPPVLQLTFILIHRRLQQPLTLQSKRAAENRAFQLALPLVVRGNLRLPSLRIAGNRILWIPVPQAFPKWLATMT